MDLMNLKLSHEEDKKETKPEEVKEVKKEKKEEKPCMFREETNECGLHRRVGQLCDIDICPLFEKDKGGLF